MTDEEAESSRRPPMLRVVGGGNPTPEELAALVVALNSISEAPRAAAVGRSGWADRKPMLRRPLEHGPGRWTTSARPAR